MIRQLFKNKNFISILLLILMSSSCFFTMSCKQQEYEKIYREDLFTINLGKLEDQIDLFQVRGSSSLKKNDFYLKDGMFYIANSNSLKVMQFSSYGDLFFILYNPDPLINPEPIMLQSEEIEGKVTNRYAASYGLLNIGSIAVDSENNIYLEDAVPEDQTIEDKKNSVILNSRILRFSKLGKLIDFIGQDGIGGTPFPYIHSIFLTKKDELVVISKIPSAWLVFWFSKKGRLMSTAKFELENLPKEKNQFVSLSAIYPDLYEQKLYLHLSYSVEELDQSTKTKTTIKGKNSRMYSYNMAENKFNGFFQIAEGGKRKYHGSIGEIEIPLPSYEFIGICEKGYFYFLRPDVMYDYELLILDNTGKLLANRYLIIDTTEEKELYLKKLKLSSNGVISGLLCYKDHVNMVWWRSDKLALGYANGQ
ncbi:MAG: hypothetical protein JXJ04_16475 [Spirochaetales bacterium]|nr:hypothetical protein [Spirochaetales bacterium]